VETRDGNKEEEGEGPGMEERRKRGREYRRGTTD
jgi:hypothetical protein